MKRLFEPPDADAPGQPVCYPRGQKRRLCEDNRIWGLGLIGLTGPRVKDLGFRGLLTGRSWL